MTTAEIEEFLAVCEMKNVSKAAEKLFRSMGTPATMPNQPILIRNAEYRCKEVFQHWRGDSFPDIHEQASPPYCVRQKRVFYIAPDELQQWYFRDFADNL